METWQNHVFDIFTYIRRRKKNKKQTKTNTNKKDKKGRTFPSVMVDDRAGIPISLKGTSGFAAPPPATFTSRRCIHCKHRVNMKKQHTQKQTKKQTFQTQTHEKREDEVSNQAKKIHLTEEEGRETKNDGVGHERSREGYITTKATSCGIMGKSARSNLHYYCRKWMRWRRKNRARSMISKRSSRGERWLWGQVTPCGYTGCSYNTVDQIARLTAYSYWCEGDRYCTPNTGASVKTTGSWCITSMENDLLCTNSQEVIQQYHRRVQHLSISVSNDTSTHQHGSRSYIKFDRIYREEACFYSLLLQGGH